MDRETARRDLTAATAGRQRAAGVWRAAIVAALAAGVSPGEVAALAECTRQRVWQIRQEEASNQLDAERGRG